MKKTMKQKKSKTMTKATFAIMLVLALALGAAACGNGAEAELPPTNTPPDARQSSAQSQSPPPSTSQSAAQSPEAPTPPATVELVVFGAASLTNTLEEIGELYKAVAPHVTLVFNFDSSGTLKTQIEEGADCDVFLSAALRQMNELGDLDLVLQSTRLELLENRVALVVPSGNPKGIKSFDDLVEALLGGDVLLGMGNSDVPVGQYTQRIFEFFDLDEEALARSGVLTYGSNVREVTTQVSEASVDCGVVYATDAFSAQLEIVGYATADMCGRVIYPAALINTTANEAEAKAFLDYLSTREAMAVFESVGFSPA